MLVFHLASFHSLCGLEFFETGVLKVQRKKPKLAATYHVSDNNLEAEDTKDFDTEQKPSNDKSARHRLVGCNLKGAVTEKFLTTRTFAEGSKIPR